MVSIPPLAENRIAERECTICPPGTIRCAHLGDWTVCFAETDLAEAHRECGPWPPYVVALHHGHPEMRCSCGHPRWDNGQDRYQGDFLSDAEAAFNAAVEELLRGDS